MTNPFRLSLAPDKLWQAINPWTFNQNAEQIGLVNIEIGRTDQPELEREILDRVGSYGRQLGRIGDALEVLLTHVKLDDLTPDEEDALTVLRGQLAEIRQIKRG
ncbi:MAG: hypothetical protein AAF719_10410 [Pseudomonadota bacterium]